MTPFVSSCGWYDDIPVGGGEASGEQGVLRIHFPVDATRTVAEPLPDVGEFILTVTGTDGVTVFDGKFCNSPDEMYLDPGTYFITVVSRVFGKPAFNAPVYGDEQCVMLKSGSVLDVTLKCTLQNCGIRLDIDSSFLDAYPESVVFLSSGDGRLLYTYREDRIAWFHPGEVSVLLDDGVEERTVAVRNLSRREILVLGLSASVAGGAGSKGSVGVQVDTSKIWNEDEVHIGSGGSGSENGNGGGTCPETFYDVEKAKEHIGETDVWVSGYIVGGDLSSSADGISFSVPFSSETHLAIASRTKVSKKSSCFSVQLSKPMRNELGLVANPSNLGRKVLFKGDIVGAYYGIPGIKNISEYEIQ